jgi:hypothetical protein
MKINSLIGILVGVEKTDDMFTLHFQVLRNNEI